MSNNNKRRDFLRTIGLGGAAIVANPLQLAAQKTGTTTETIKLENEFEIELLTEGDLFKGVGKVSIQQVPVRNGAVPMLCEIRNPEGVQVAAFHIISKTVTKEKISIRMNVTTLQTGLMDWMLHTVRNREYLYNWTEDPVMDKNTIVTLDILPVKKRIGNYEFTGFSYQYSFSSTTFPIYRITDKATWEIDAKATGNECWMRLGHVPSIFPIRDIGQHYSTEAYIKGLANPNVFQFLPLQTELQGFTFTAHEKGVLITWAAKPAHIRTLIEKPRNHNRLFHFHQHCADLAYELQTSPVEVLWLSLPANNYTSRSNVYEAVRADVSKQLHQQTGIKEERLTTYGVLEEWLEPDFDDYTNRILPQFIEKGIKRIFLPNQMQNAMNTWGLSNMCCNVDYKLSETAGVEKIRQFCKKAADAGILVEMWGNTALSTLTEMFQWRDGKQKGITFLPKEGSITEVLQKAKEPFVRNASNAIEADHYTPRFAALNLRDKDIYDYWMQSWKKVYETGIHGIFLDSSFNMTSDKFHFIYNTEKEQQLADEKENRFRPAKPHQSAILSQYPAHLQLIKDMQEAGFSYSAEDAGVFGIHRHGTDINMALHTMPVWRDCVATFNEEEVKAKGLDPLLVFFKGLAYRIVWMLRWDFVANKLNLGIENEKAYALLKVYNQAELLMNERELIADGKALLYSSAGGKILWVFEDFEYKTEKKVKAKELLSGKAQHTKKLSARALCVYHIV